MKNPTITQPADPLSAPLLKEQLEALEFTFQEAPYAFWRAKGSGCVVTFYGKGKIVLQGAAAVATAAYLDLDLPDAEPEGEPFAAALEKHPDPKPKAWIGTDETGKGDYFGPLVVVAVRVERERVPLLAELGVADSKTLSDKRILAIAKDLKQAVAFRTVVTGPEAYNRLYEKIGNVNRLLGWAHARAIEDILQIAPADYVLTDQFGNRRLVESRLMEQGQKIRLDQRPKAEEDPAVAAASILARNEFVWRMRALSREVGFELPKGAGPPVLAAGKRLVAEHGATALRRFAKLHFKTTKTVTGE